MTGGTLGRRRLLRTGACAALLGSAGARAAPRPAGSDPAEPSPAGTLPGTGIAGGALDDSPGPALTLVIGGPSDSASGRLADLLAPLIEPRLLGPAVTAGGVPGGDPRLALQTTGGADGVTAANAFEARANPDGSTALVVPGVAALAWLAGDPRVHFDAALWVPALATVAPAVLVGRLPAGGLVAGARIRVGATTPAGRELPALLALHLLGIDPAPVFGLHGPGDDEAALRDGRIDAMLLAGTDVPSRLASLAASGLAPLFALGAPDGGRDPELAAVPTADEVARRGAGQPLEGPLVPAFRAASAATRLDSALVLPPLVPPEAVTRWRDACDAATSSLSLRSAVAAAALRPLPAPACVAAVSAAIAGETAQLDLHRFLAERYGWRPA